jgi:hypothetical protein
MEQSINAVLAVEGGGGWRKFNESKNAKSSVIILVLELFLSHPILIYGTAAAFVPSKDASTLKSCCFPVIRPMMYTIKLTKFARFEIIKSILCTATQYMYST